MHKGVPARWRAKGMAASQDMSSLSWIAGLSGYRPEQSISRTSDNTRGMGRADNSWVLSGGHILNVGVLGRSHCH